ncbi:Dbl homology domain-containing protein [Umbelopsis sp. PMI_123]|nr:Dbl homology domain-containing protein [Umbelopsis sp. PMI_123]
MLRRASKGAPSNKSSSNLSFTSLRSADSLSRSNSSMQEKLLEDMSIIDDLYNDFADQVETDFYEVEVRYRDREQAIQDIYNSELEYMALLQLGREIFESKMRLQVQQQSKRGGLLSGSNKVICTDQEINILFALHQDIMTTHHRFLDELDERFRIWGPTQLISDVYREFLPKLAMVTQKRLQSFSASIMTLERLMKSNAFKKLMETWQQDSPQKKITVLEILKAPILRLKYYAPALRVLAQNTDPLHPDYAHMLRCTAKFESLNQDMAASLEDATKLCDAYELFQILRESPVLMTEDRRLHMRSDLTKFLTVDGSNPEPRVVLLFTEVLVYGRLMKDGTISYRGQVDLSTATARAHNTESNKRSHCFEVIALEHQVVSTMSMAGGPNMLLTTGGSTTTVQIKHLFQTRSREEQTKWVNELQRLIRLNKEKKAKPTNNTVRQSSDVPSLSRSTTSSSSSTAASGGDAFDLRGKPLYKKLNPKSPVRGINSHEFVP